MCHCAPIIPTNTSLFEVTPFGIYLPGFWINPGNWPAIWHANQQIQNPHLIYPGDRISLVYVDGSPRLVVDRGKPTLRMSPDIRELGREAISGIPLDRIKPFIKNARIIGAEQFASAALRDCELRNPHERNSG